MTVSPGWTHPVAYWNAFTFIMAVVFGIAGLRLRRGSNKFISY